MKFFGVILSFVIGVMLSLFISNIIFKNNIQNKKIEKIENNNIKIENTNNLKKENYLRDKFNTYLKDNVKMLSNDTRKIIVENILKTKYPEIIFSIIKNESSFKWWVYTNVKIKIKNKIIYTKSIGLGSVIWEWWKPLLVKNNIRAKSDLFIIEKNIKATDLIFQYLLKRNKGDLKKAILDYFGGNKKWYLNRVLKTIGELNLKKLKEI